jgi:hypothetical protein
MGEKSVLPKMKLDSFLITTDLLSDLFNNFDLKKIDIFGMGFNDKMKESDEGNLIIGGIDTDQIVVDKKIQEVKERRITLSSSRLVDALQIFSFIHHWHQ